MSQMVFAGMMPRLLPCDRTLRQRDQAEQTNSTQEGRWAPAITWGFRPYDWAAEEVGSSSLPLRE